MRVRYTSVSALLLLLLAGSILMTAQSGADPSPRCAVIGRGADGPSGEIKCRESALAAAPTGSAQIPSMLFRLAETYQTLGEGKAEEYYKKLVTDHCKRAPDLCGEAQKRLATLQSKNNGARRIDTPFTQDPYGFALSPDGQQLVYLTTAGGKSALWLHDLKTGKAGPISGTESGGYGRTMGGAHPFWSPDSKTIGFFAEGKLKRIDAAGGVPQIIADAPYNYGGSWNRDGVIIFVRDNINAVYRVPATGGVPQRITELTSANTSHRFPQFLSDGRHFLFYRINVSGSVGAPQNSLAVGSLESAEVKELNASVQAVQAARVSSSDQLLIVGQRALFAQHLDPIALELTGALTSVAEQVADFRATATPGYAAVSVSHAGPVAYRAKDSSNTQLIWYDRQGRQVGRLGQPEDSASAAPPSFSPDGRTVAVVTARSDGAYVRLIDAADGNTRSFFVADIARFRWDKLGWSTDGKSILFSLTPPGGGGSNVYRRAIASGVVEQVTTNRGNESVVADASSDGNTLLYTFATGIAGMNQLRATPPSGGSGFVVVQGVATGSGRFSPNGRWIAYEMGGPAANADQIRIAPFGGSAAVTALPSLNGRDPKWSSDGRELYFVSSDNRLMAAAVKLPDANGDIALGEPQSLFNLPEGAAYTPEPGGSRFLLNLPLEAAPPIYVVSDWPRSRPAATSSKLPSTTPLSSAAKQIAVFDRRGNPIARVGTPYTGTSGSLTLSPDGTKIATIRNGELSVTDISSNTTTRVAMDAIQAPVWSGDGRRLAYLADRDAISSIYIRALSSAGDEQLIFRGAGTGKATRLWNWSVDGRFIGAIIADRVSVLSVMDNRRVQLASAADKTAIRLSPLGDLLAYISNETLSNQVFIRSFDPGDPAGYTQRQITSGGAVGMLRWRADGEEIYYVDPKGAVMAVPVIRSPQLRTGTPTVLFQAPAGFPVNAAISDVIADVSADGQRFVFLVPAE